MLLVHRHIAVERVSQSLERCVLCSLIVLDHELQQIQLYVVSSSDNVAHMVATTIGKVKMQTMLLCEFMIARPYLTNTAPLAVCGKQPGEVLFIGG